MNANKCTKNVFVRTVVKPQKADTINKTLKERGSRIERTESAGLSGAAHGTPFFFSDGIPQAAAALSYFLLFSLLPLLMFVNALVARLSISIEDFRPVFELMPKSLQELILSYFEQITATPSFSPLLIGTLLTLYFLSRAVRSIMRTVEASTASRVHRRALLDILLSFAMTAGFLLTVGSFVLAVAGRMLPSAAAGAADPRTSVGKAWMMIVIVFAFLMPVQPHRPEPASRVPRGLAGGAVFAGGMGARVVVLFVLCGQYGAVFRALRLARDGHRAPVIWLYLVSIILLMGPQLNHTLVVMRLYRMEQTAHLK